MHHPHFGMEKMEQRLRKLSQVKEEVMMKKAHPTLLFHFLDNPFHILLNLPFSVSAVTSQENARARKNTQFCPF